MSKSLRAHKLGATRTQIDFRTGNEVDHLMILLMLMVDSGIPELSSLEDVAWVPRALMVAERDDAKAAAAFLGRVDAALDDRRTRSMHAIHSLVHTS